MQLAPWIQMRSLRHVSLAISLFALASVAAPAARADAGGPWYAGVGLGPTVPVRYGATHFRVEGDLGYHTGGHDTGFFLGANLATSFGPDFIQFQAGLRLGGDIEIHSTNDLAVLITPSGVVGGGLLDFDNGYWRDLGYDRTYGYFVIQPAIAVSIVLVQRLLHVWVRPLAFDLLFFPNHFDDRFSFDAIYSLLAGVFFTF